MAHPNDCISRCDRCANDPAVVMEWVRKSRKDDALRLAVERVDAGWGPVVEVAAALAMLWRDTPRWTFTGWRDLPEEMFEALDELVRRVGSP